ncbi:MAG: hypothetical protein ACR2N9_02660 [Acidimicrobiia bacterium]
MKKLIKLVFLLLFMAMIAGAVASYLSKKRFESMSDDEIRDMLAVKLGDRVSEDQLASIQDAVVAGVRARKPNAEDHYVEDVQHAVEDLTEVAHDVEDAGEDAAEDAAEDKGVDASEAGEKGAEAVDAIADAVTSDDS